MSSGVRIGGRIDQAVNSLRMQVDTESTTVSPNADRVSLQHSWVLSIETPTALTMSRVVD